MAIEETPVSQLFADFGLNCCTASELAPEERTRVEAITAQWRRDDAGFSEWASGYGVIPHDPLTQWRIHQLLESTSARNGRAERAVLLERMIAADRVASAGLWLTVHMTYARVVKTDGSSLDAVDFKASPEGHTGGSLNMVIGYVGYLLANALSGHTRSWLMGQGHCVAAIDATNVLVGNMTPEHAARYDRSDAGLTRFVRDFYSYAIGPDGAPASPLGSHVNPHTAGGILEGGYLGFAELLYPHMPLPGERLVAFLSDGAFEEQRGSDWAPRWWRPEDCGLVAPIMVLNGRRIEQRSEIEQQGGERWLHRHLRLNGFEPIGLDGRDPASIAWGVLEIEARLTAQTRADGPLADRSFRLGYGIAQAPKGYGFPGAGTNRAHNLPLEGNPSKDAQARTVFNTAARRLWVAPAVLDAAVDTLHTHLAQARALERDHPLAHRRVPLPMLPEPDWCAPDAGEVSPMAAIDAYFVRVTHANPALRVRVANPDELRSNKLDRTLDTLKHRTSVPEAGVAESRTGTVITALNEEAVICAALGNKGGLNLAVTYEAFGVKMLGALRQEIIFARHQAEAGRAPGWLGVPLLLTSHTWENAKNEQSHQDPTFVEALLGEMSDTARVLFPIDANSALSALRSVYRSHGQVAALVIPKRALPVRLVSDAAERLVQDGVLVVSGEPAQADLLLVVVGAYQLDAALRATERLRDRRLAVAVIAIIEPGRLRQPRDAREAHVVIDDSALEGVFPSRTPRIFITHTHPEPLLGLLRRVDTGAATTRALGYRNRGGTLDVQGLLFANRCTWAHVVEAAAAVLKRPLDSLLIDAERAAIAGTGDPAVLQ